MTVYGEIAAILHPIPSAKDLPPVMPGPAGNRWADAVVAIGAAAVAVAVRFAVFTVPRWQWVSAVCGGRLLAPDWLGVVDTS
jgi:hypothetical protein